MPRKHVKRSYDPDATRARILDAASAAFQRDGYHATSMHGIMASANVPGGSMYHYFPAKKSLALAVIAERVAPAVEETWIRPLQNSADVREGVLRVFADVASSIERRGGKAVGCPVGNLAVELSLADRQLQAALVRVYERWGDAMRTHLGRALATTIVATFSGAMTLAKTMQSAEPVRECATIVKRMLAS